MNLKIEKVVNSKRKEEIKKIYTSSFVKKERIPFDMMLMLSKMKRTEFLAYYDEDVLVGFVYLGVIQKITFVMFLAVDEKLRSKGYGHSILENIQWMYPNNKIILSIEPSGDNSYSYTQRSKRKRFYLDNGFLETGYYMKCSGKKQEIIIRNGIFSKLELLKFFACYSNMVMLPKIWNSKI